MDSGWAALIGAFIGGAASWAGAFTTLRGARADAKTARQRELTDAASGRILAGLLAIENSFASRGRHWSRVVPPLVRSLEREVALLPPVKWRLRLLVLLRAVKVANVGGRKDHPGGPGLAEEWVVEMIRLVVALMRDDGKPPPPSAIEQRAWQVLQKRDSKLEAVFADLADDDAQ
ncbi:hypothetical protein OKJ48_04750 [Streptomyces kunmingensis]|uniref:Uncharacterized protein n=1 Tax=Streptomyces kunmingensis TaxID=68225 RepID=A0ABU6C4L1_9ACTN|nr:hypothetical protein [Streptomyces kunmingensis]MEB3959562.1 hypothetical protein [Streptomyces kunmingensis]